MARARHNTIKGFFGVINQPRMNYFYGQSWKIKNRKLVTKLAPIAFKIWRYYAAMNVVEGAMCDFAYTVKENETNNCKDWTERALKQAKLLTILPF